MSQFSSLRLILLAVFAALFAAIHAQPVNQTATIAAIVTTTQYCQALRGICEEIDSSNVSTEGVVLSFGGFFAVLNTVHEDATGLEKADPGYFENPPLVLLTFIQFQEAMKGLITAITDKRTILISGGFKAQLYEDLTSLVAVVDALADELAKRGTAQYILGFYQVKENLDSLLESCIATFSDV